MKRVLTFILVLLFSISLIGCNQSDSSKNDNENKATDSKNIKNEASITPSGEAGITGYVIKMKGGRILVVSTEVKDFSSNGGVSEFYNAIWFSKASQDIKLGDKVQVWYDLVLDSYPGQAEAKYLEVIPGKKPDGADLTETEALSKSLASQKINPDEMTVVKSLEYDNKTDMWNIKLKSIMGEKIFDIQVEDKN